MSKLDEVSDILEMQLKGVDTKTAFEEVGTVLEVGDGVAMFSDWTMCVPVSWLNLRMECGEWR